MIPSSKNIGSNFQCPICLNFKGMAVVKPNSNGVPEKILCDFCGQYSFTLLAWKQYDSDRYTKENRMAVSHLFLMNTLAKKFDENVIKEVPSMNELFENTLLPHKLTQENNALIFIGSICEFTKESLEELPENFCSIVGTLDNESVVMILEKLKNEKLINYSNFENYIKNINITNNGKKKLNNIELYYSNQ